MFENFCLNTHDSNFTFRQKYTYFLLIVFIIYIYSRKTNKCKNMQTNIKPIFVSRDNRWTVDASKIASKIELFASQNEAERNFAAH